MIAVKSHYLFLLAICITVSLPFGNAFAEEPVVVVVNKSNSAEELSLGELARIYEGKQTQWKDGSKLMVINRPVESPPRVLFYKVVLKTGPGTEFFQSGRPAPFKTLIQESASAVKRMVSRMPNAVGYIDFDELDNTVKSIAIDGILPTQENINSKKYPLQG